MNAHYPDTMLTVLPVFGFVFGAVIGSFLNVVIYRLPRGDEGLSIASPRLSICPQCRATIRAYDNIPLLSYFMLAGRCRACRARIPLRYFVVELLTATLFAYMAARFTGSWGLLGVHLALAATLVAVTFIDIDFQIIPDVIDLPGLILAPVVSFLLPELFRTGRGGELGDLTLGDRTIGIADPRLAAVTCSLLGIAAGAGTVWLIALVGRGALAVLRRLGWTDKQDAMGFGDVKLLGMIGGYIGWKGVFLSLLLACFAGSAIGLVMKRVTKSSYIPFGPFLSLGAVGVILFRPEIMHFIFETWPEVAFRLARAFSRGP